MRKRLVQSLGWEDPLENRIASHYIILAWGIPWTVESFPFSRGSSQLRDQTQVSCNAGWFFTSWATRGAPVYSMGSQRVRYNWVTFTFILLFTFPTISTAHTPKGEALPCTVMYGKYDNKTLSQKLGNLESNCENVFPYLCSAEKRAGSPCVHANSLQLCPTLGHLLGL